MTNRVACNSSSFFLYARQGSIMDVLKMYLVYLDYPESLLPFEKSLAVCFVQLQESTTEGNCDGQKFTGSQLWMTDSPRAMGHF